MLKGSGKQRAIQGALLGGAAVAALCAFIAFLPARAATPVSNNGIPALMQEPNIAWRAYQFGGRRGPPSRADIPYDKTANEWQAPETGIGPITADPAHPFYNNAVAADLGISSTYRYADLNNEAAKNLMPWAIDALKKQNALVLANKNGETRQARCWEVGVPDIHEAPWEWYFIQTPKEVVIVQAGAMQTVRRIYLNVPHSKNVKPSWYGESVGHYENGDTLVVDTIGLSDRTFVDGYRTPHTTGLHVVERFKITNGGKTLEASFTADDPGTFYKSWGARRPRDRVDSPWEEQACSANNDDILNQGFDPVPTADHPDF
ncbi:MAG TPA: hypothetical protein VEU06_09180 [Micropepsaceae bacterium]|nr:hypothetical protein [Micropepsaceae bacterium]